MVSPRKLSEGVVLLPRQSATLTLEERGHFDGKSSLVDLAPSEQTVEHGAALRLARPITDFQLVAQRFGTDPIFGPRAEGLRNESADAGDLGLLSLGGVTASASREL